MLTLKKYKFILCILVVVFIIISNLFYSLSQVCYSKLNGYTIVLDAGHGGRDGGSVGINGTIEKDINLKYTMALKENLIKNGYKVVLTRKNDEGLYSPLAKNKKQSDMSERLKIIKKSNPNLVISIHMNSFSDSSVYGANTYYRKDDSSGEFVASLIQKAFHHYCEAPNNKPKVGDYYILNSSYYTVILIEFGFISNPNDEQNLNSKSYMDKMIQTVTNTLNLYFE